MDWIAEIEIILILLLVGSAFMVIRQKNLITCLCFMMLCSLFTAALFAVMAAPDVAITEAAIGASISTLFMLVTIRVVGQETSGKLKNKYPALLVCVLLFAVFMAVLPGMPEYGSADSPANKGVGKYYIENTREDIGIPAAVTAVLASYRGFDTLGELYVILAAGIAVMLILPNTKRKKRGKKSSI